jgi:hypothetical protein
MVPKIMIKFKVLPSGPIWQTQIFRQALLHTMWKMSQKQAMGLSEKTGMVMAETVTDEMLIFYFFYVDVYGPMSISWNKLQSKG